MQGTCSCFTLLQEPAVAAALQPTCSTATAELARQLDYTEVHKEPEVFQHPSSRLGHFDVA